jgi:serine/threonine protein kinase/Flp pilus assembly protein TadD
MKDRPTVQRQQVDEILYQALETPSETRAEYLDAACAGDDVLRREVDSLLDATEAMGEDFLREPLLSVNVEPTPELADGRRLGSYRILREIARGGMGTVYLAARADEEFEREVAVKILKRGLDTDEIVRRFLHERQILAQLTHPHISRLLDGGTTEDGRPYLVMEKVEGERIDRWCDRHRLSVRERLELFSKVCSTVQFAHQRLVVHRDLKPANILVDEEGEPTLLDFGIAKLLEAGAERLTRAGLRPMTLEHASPEQIRGEPVTTASDVYALGGLLYELLTGCSPHGDLRGSPEMVFHRVCNEDPPSPSRALVKAEGDRSPKEIAAARSTDPRTLRRHLAGDLDSIVLKALERDPERRYRSAEQLAEDLRRHLDGEPVTARAASVPYRAGKFVRRHWVGVALTAAAMVLIVGFGLRESVLRDQAEKERQVAESQRRVAETVKTYMVDIFRSPSPEQAQGEKVTVRQILDEKSRKILTYRTLPPEVRAVLMDAMGYSYLGLGLYEEAEPLLVESLRLHRASSETRPEDLATTLFHLVVLRRAQDRRTEAEALADEGLALLRERGTDPGALARGLTHRAGLYKDAGDLEAAEALYRESLALKIENEGEVSEDVATGKNNLGVVLKEEGRLDEAERLYRESMDLHHRLGNDESTGLTSVQNNLAVLLQEKGDLDAAEDLFRENLALRRKVYGDDHRKVANSLNNLAFVLQLQGRFEEAGPLYLEAMKILSMRLGEGHREVAAILRNLAQLDVDRGDPAQAETRIRRALQIFGTTLSANHWHLADAKSVLGAALAAQGRREEAEPLLRESLAALEAGDAPERQTREARERLARFEKDRP